MIDSLRRSHESHQADLPGIAASEAEENYQNTLREKSASRQRLSPSDSNCLELSNVCASIAAIELENRPGFVPRPTITTASGRSGNSLLGSPLYDERKGKFFTRREFQRGGEDPMVLIVPGYSSR